MSAGSASRTETRTRLRFSSTRRFLAAFISLAAALSIIGCSTEVEPRPTYVAFQSRGGDSFEQTERVWGHSDCDSIAITVNGSLVDASIRRSGKRFQARIPLQQGPNAVVARCEGARDTSASDSLSFDLKLTDPPAADEVGGARDRPTWLKRAVVYAPVAELWGNDGAVAVRRNLPYLKRLGANVLWLWPPASSRAPGEEYAITDYFRVDESWGSKKALQVLIAEAHAQEMRVIVDFVPNHMSRRSPYFRDAATYGRSSAYWDFFDRDARGRPMHYFDWVHLPNLNFDNPEVRNMLIEASTYWMEEMGVDGFRMDVAWGVRRRHPGFWTQLSQAIKAINPDAMLLAEDSARAPYYRDNGFDVAYDWTNELGEWAWAKAFATPTRTGALLRRAIARVAGRDGLVLRFINNNDTGRRFVDRYGPELTMAAATLQFTVPGVPAMFAGDEIGASFEPYTEIGRIPWRDRYGLRPFYKKLIEIRRKIPALTSHRIDLLHTNDPGTLAFIRPSATGSPVLVVLNFGQATEVHLSGRGLRALPAEMIDLLTDAEVRLDRERHSASIPLDGRSALVLSSRERHLGP